MSFPSSQPFLLIRITSEPLFAMQAFCKITNSMTFCQYIAFLQLQNMLHNQIWNDCFFSHLKNYNIHTSMFRFKIYWAVTVADIEKTCFLHITQKFGLIIMFIMLLKWGPARQVTNSYKKHKHTRILKLKNSNNTDIGGLLPFFGQNPHRSIWSSPWPSSLIFSWLQN